MIIPIKTALRERLATEYGIEAIALMAGPRGFVGETYIVESPDAQRYFVKLLPAGSHLAALTGNLRALEELHALGIDRVSRPRRTRSGRQAAELDGRPLLVFDFIAGRSGATATFDYEQYVGLLARLHRATPHLKTPLPAEDFSLRFSSIFEELFRRVCRTRPVSQPQKEQAALIGQRREQILEDWAELQEVARSCRKIEYRPVLTHSDANGDNLIVAEDGKLYLIDWDELMLGPAERDNWFHLLEAASRAEFLRVYRHSWPDYRPEPIYLRFYVLRRFFEDLYGFLAIVLDSPSVEQQAANYRLLQQTCFEWLWPLLRRPVPES